MKRFLQELSDNDDDDDDDVVVPDNKEQTQTKTDVKESKKADAVEKPMDEKQLNQFYNEYILLMKDQKQEKHAFTREKLCDILHELFNSLQYQPDQSDGQLTFPACQICLDEETPMVTMKVTSLSSNEKKNNNNNNNILL